VSIAVMRRRGTSLRGFTMCSSGFSRATHLLPTDAAMASLRT
jgi:hypothetical protein